MTNATVKAAMKNALMGVFKEGDNSFNTLGSLVWWHVRNAKITKDELANLLVGAGINPKYSKDHNYRSAFIRALRDMEEKRIIRLVEESPAHLMYQFTTEARTEASANLTDITTPRLQYDPETVVTVDKEAYKASQNIETALHGREDIVKRLLGLFQQEKSNYQSADVTRMIQRIFEDEADLVRMRENGGIYFVPVAYSEIITKVASVVSQIGNSSLEFLPLPDVAACRAALKNAVKDEIDAALTKLSEEIDSMSKGDGLTDKKAEHRLSQVRKLQERIEHYMGVLEGDGTRLKSGLDRLEKFIVKNRVLDLE